MSVNIMKAIVAAILVAGVVGQDTTPCSSYDARTGKGVCNGVNVDIGGVICAGGFDKSKCKASYHDDAGMVQTFYFKGTPTGLPSGPSIESDCTLENFPSSGGIAMAQTYTNGGKPAGCYPAADVVGTTLSYTPNGQGLASVTIDFNVHTDNGGTQRDGFVFITCVSGGPTSNFAYTTTGDQGHQSQYQISTRADCTASGPAPPPAPPGPPGPGPEGYWCIDNTTCLFGPQPSPKYKGGTKEECAAICKPPAYVCRSGQCIEDARGGTLKECQDVCF